MFRRDYRDVIGGFALLIGGLSFAIYAIANYQMGTMRNMGPGMFPAGLGFILAGFGLAITLTALTRSGTMPEIRIWTPLFVLAGVAAFAATIRPFGLIPAIIAVTVVSSFAQLEVRPVNLALLCTALCVIAWLTFRVGLGLTVPLFRMPF